MPAAHPLSILVGASRLPNEISHPTLVVDAEAQHIRAFEQQRNSIRGGKNLQLTQATLGESNDKVSWFRFNDARLNGPVPPETWRQYYPNLQLDSREIVTAETLASILNQWESSHSSAIQSIELVISQGDPLAILKGAGDWIAQLQRVEIKGPRAGQLWDKTCTDWLHLHGFQRDTGVPMGWSKTISPTDINLHPVKPIGPSQESETVSAASSSDSAEPEGAEAETYAAMIENRIYIAQSTAQKRTPLAILQGVEVSTLLKLKNGSKKEWPQLIDEDIDLLNHFREATTKEHCRTFQSSGVNIPKEWSLDGGRTLHIALQNTASHEIIPVFKAVRLEANSSTDWELEALLACHRGQAELELTVVQGMKQHKRTIPFNEACLGGKSKDSYQHAVVTIPIEAGEALLSLEIKHFSFLKDQGNNRDTFYFISNPIFRSTENASLQRQIPAPRSIGPSGRPPNGFDQWRAEIRHFSSGRDEALNLQWDDGTIDELFKPLRGSAQVVEDYGHTLIINTDDAGRFALYINRSFEQFLDLSTGNTALTVPRQWLRGEAILLELRDASGSQVYFSHAVLAPRQITPTDLLLKETSRPFPTDLTCRANHRYQALRNHLRFPIKGLSKKSLSQALETLDGNYETVKLLPLSFPEHDSPEVSIVIPAHNKVEVSYYALCALLAAHNTTSFEVILVDDGSTDETAEIDELVSGITVIHNEEPLRFIKACNRGVNEARGTYVVLLNNDTEVTVGWLDALVDAFQRFKGVGAVGSKLLFPDGTLQDAGGIIWGSGNPWNYGSKQNPWDPRYSYSRQVDYLSGAALMTTKAIWDEVGGLSSYLEPMYFEDTDFSFKVRDAGYKTYFVPSSVVYHFEGTTSGTDTSSGFKRFQEVNRPKFKRRWAKAFANHGEEGIQPDLEKDRGIIGRILFIDYATPREDRDAGSYAAIREIELVQALGYKVTFLPQNLGFFGNYTEQLQRMGVEVITAPFYPSLASFLEERAREFDAAYITRYYVAADTVHLIREHSPKTRIILNNADLHFLRELRAAMSENDEARLEVMRDVRNQELAMMRNVDLVLSYNDVEHAVISSHTDGQVKVMTCPWVVEIPDTVAPLEAREGLSFLGSFKHHPNNEGVQWFCREVMARLEDQQLTFFIYGSGMDEEIKELASDWIDPVGYIEDVADAYQRHRVFVAPLLSGAGIKGKVLNALAYGIPTVLTPTAAEGIGLRHGHDCLIAKKPEEWVEAIRRLSQDDKLWHSISFAARNYAASQFSFEAGREKMKTAFEAVDLFSHIDE